jgi:hypothetical protein
MTDHERQRIRTSIAMELRPLLAKMDVPPFRREQMLPQNVSWLMRNLAINNDGHPNLEEAMVLVKKLDRLYRHKDEA